MMKKFLGIGILATCVAASATSAQADHIWEGDAFFGGWSIPNMNHGNIVVGDGNGSGLSLGGTQRYCGARGTSYSVMNDYIDSNWDDGGMSWFVDRICDDGYVRICVYNTWGDIACSTYEDYGWVRLD